MRLLQAPELLEDLFRRGEEASLLTIPSFRCSTGVQSEGTKRFGFCPLHKTQSYRVDSVDDRGPRRLFSRLISSFEQLCKRVSRLACLCFGLVLNLPIVTPILRVQYEPIPVQGRSCCCGTCRPCSTGALRSGLPSKTTRGKRKHQR